MVIMKVKTPYFADDGFGDRVMRTLPVRRTFRMQVIGFSWALSLVAAALLWVFGKTSFPMYGLDPSVC